MSGGGRRRLWARAGPGLRFILVFGVVSLFADLTYEGARSVSGPFLGLLGAGAATVGVVAGLGELVGYGLRLFSGWAADRTERYWLITLAGYAVNLLAVPFLALAGSWQLAAVLLISERAGKGLRTPPRDAMLSFAATEVGQGRGYGIHEAMDQIGAVIGPLAVALVLSLTGSHRIAFGSLLLPAVAALLVLLWIRRRYPEPRALGPGRGENAAGASDGAEGPSDDASGSPPRSGGEAPDGAEDAPPPPRQGQFSFPRRYWIYLGGVSLLAAGFADFALVAYHFQARQILRPEWIPLAYALAMGVDAAGALLFGESFDRTGPTPVLVAAALLSAAAAPLVFLTGGGAGLAVGLGLWGVGMGAQESVMRATVARMVAPQRRGTAFGAFNAAYGLAWFLGSALLGVLYESGLWLVVAVSAGFQLLAIPVFLAAGRSGDAR